MQAGGYVPPALTLVIPGYDSLVLASVHVKNMHYVYILIYTHIHTWFCRTDSTSFAHNKH